MVQDPDNLIERLLDLALEATFPASDPVSISSAAANAALGRLTFEALP